MLTTQPKNLTDRLTITIFVRRQTCDGMTVESYADGVIAQTHPTLTHEEFEHMFGACPEDIAAITNFVTSHGLTVDYAHCCAASVIATGSVGQINSMFGVVINDVIDDTISYISHSNSISWPDNLRSMIEHVDGLDTSLRFIPAIVPTSTPTPGYNTPIGIPQKAATAYEFPGLNNGFDGQGQVIALIQPWACGYTQQNLNSTFATYGISGTTVVDYLLDGRVNNPATGSVNTNGEVMLDIAMVAGIVPKSTIVVYICNTIASAMHAILFDPQNKGYKPKIVSMSIGGGEGFATSQADNLFAQATVLGVTLIASSGDWGAYDAPVGYVGPPARGFGPCWPASSPYVLSIGGTSLALNANGTIASEVTWNNNGEDYHITGGNQSIRYALPTWQQAAGIQLKDYATGISSAPTGRAVPDVAFVGDGNTGFTYFFYYPSVNVNFRNNFGGGTSASAPLWAGLIARINTIAGKPAGFVTSKFYDNPDAFNDILPTSVANNNAYLGVGFSTTSGWDACTGWGSPKGQAVADVLVPVKAKIAESTWSPIKNIQVKTSDTAWSTAKVVWIKTAVNKWQQVYTQT